MPRHGGKHVVLVKGAEDAMKAFKMEIAEDLGLMEKITEANDFRNLSTVEVGRIGGEMVRRLQAMGEKLVKERYDSDCDRLLPAELLPKDSLVRSVSNNGNSQPQMQASSSMSQTPTYQEMPLN